MKLRKKKSPFKINIYENFQVKNYFYLFYYFFCDVFFFLVCEKKRQKLMHFQRLFIFSILLSFGLCQSASVEELLAAGQCEPFDDSPIACQAVMVDAWSSVWTVPSYGLTQEYFVAQMNMVDPQLGMSPIDLVNVLPSDCAFQYLKMICPTFLHPCTSTNSSQLIPSLPPAIPHSVCRSVCEVCYLFFILFLC